MTLLASTRDRVEAPCSQPTSGEGETRAAPGDSPSKWHMIGQGDGGEVDFNREVIEGLLARREFFWLDLRARALDARRRTASLRPGPHRRR